MKVRSGDRRKPCAEFPGSTVKRALDSYAPSLVEVPVTRDVSVAAAEVVGWWDFPVLPTASEAVKADYKAGYAAEQHRRSASDGELSEPVSAVGELTECRRTLGGGQESTISEDLKAAGTGPRRR